MHVTRDELRDFAARAFVRVGLPESDACIIGELMAEAEFQGSEGHGIMRMNHYIRRIQAGGVNPKPNIRVVEERAAMALVDGDNGMGHLVMKRATGIAIEKARTCGVAWVGSQHSNHAGPASLYPRMALEHGMVALYFAVGNANHLPPWGGLDMLLSTNPIAVAIPTHEEPPVVLDMATTVAAYGKVKTKAQRGETMPVGWMIDRQGNPLTDPKRSAEGLLLPIGGYKGYGLALVFGLLAGTLNGAAMGKDVIDFNADDVTPTNTGQAICVIDPAAFGDPLEFKKRVDVVVRDLRASERMPGVERIWLPGEQSHLKKLEAQRNGTPIAPALQKSLDTLADSLGILRLSGGTP
ncbi:putative oxidoreductase YjmC [Usitatibacter rugosus]|uniref:Putative oxidoreductase YjmC n=1 Tax=Usitatibacter rugosus TaxID=2732067 RepID=A0A6M4GW19_9PROT|nr:Ldh family oxidoreductase [Usitatibacter rugosus]QJR09837.1 putative oxidoreductase YjmC [Usitatibacter rugosus]